MNQVRQGDLLVKTIDSLPGGVKRVVDNILLRGEVTGHSHRMVNAQVFSDTAGMLFFKVNKKATLVHEEHNPIEFSRGIYAVLRQREYTGNDMTRVVVD